ncbi:hypothetical protein F5B18DRAFT_657072 [Nemania serpens]|nr:hypothetical protein F5B18DRAFT_657072 [Nemania serpens]
MFGILTGLLAVASATPIFNASVTEGSMNATWGGNEVGIIPVTNMGCWSVKLEADETFVATWKLAQWGREHHIGAGAIHGEYYGLAATWVCNCKHFVKDHVVAAELDEARKRLDFECGPNMAGWVWSKPWQKSINCINSWRGRQIEDEGGFGGSVSWFLPLAPRKGRVAG